MATQSEFVAVWVALMQGAGNQWCKADGYEEDRESHLPALDWMDLRWCALKEAHSRARSANQVGAYLQDDGLLYLGSLLEEGLEREIEAIEKRRTARDDKQKT